MSRIEEILTLDKRITEESGSHLQQKANMSKELKDLTSKEKILVNQIIMYNERINSNNTDNSLQLDIDNLINTKNDLINNIEHLKAEIGIHQDSLSKSKKELENLNSSVSTLDQDKREKVRILLVEKQKITRSKRANVKLKNAQERMRKIKGQFEQQVKIKKNLESFYNVLSKFQLVVSSHSPLSDEKSELPEGINLETKNQILYAKKFFDQAQTKFSATDVTPFLIDAQRAYEEIISVFIQLCPEIPNSLLEEDFSTRVFHLVNNGLILNTRHLNAVQSMLLKLDKGVEIAPLASFANEVKLYFRENLTYLRITGVLLE